MTEIDMLKSVGMRVVAISHADEKGLHVFGHGVYEGCFQWGDTDSVEPHELTPEERITPNLWIPRIRLDSGQYVWGLECWWVAETDYDANPPEHEIPADP